MALSTTFILSLICCILTVDKTQATKAPPASQAPTTPTVRTTTTTAVPTLKFSCSDGKVDELSGVGIHFESIVILKGAEEMCHYSASDCIWKGKSKKVYIRYDKDETNPDVVAGKNPEFYELECKSGYLETANAQAIIISEPTRSYTHKEVLATAGLNKMKITLHEKNQPATLSGPVDIGDELLLKITFPEHTNGIPMSCNATSQTKTAVLWDKKDCKSKDKVIMEDNWTADSNSISINMFAFRFVDSTSVTIVCSAYVCPDSDTNCKTEVKSCLSQSGGVGRRRRNSDLVTKHLNEYRKQSSSASFTVVDRYGGANGSGGVSVNTVLYLTAVLITMCLLRGE